MEVQSVHWFILFKHLKAKMDPANYFVGPFGKPFPSKNDKQIDAEQFMKTKEKRCENILVIR